MSSRRPAPEGPEPFTSEWIESPPPPPPPRSRAGLPAWVPSERALTAALVLILVLGTALFGSSGGDAHIGSASTSTPPQMAAAVSTSASATAMGGTPATALPPIVIAPAATPAASPTSVAVASGATAVADPNALLPKYRILSYYGHPGSATMGILGEYDKDTLYQKLQEQAAAYQQVDPNRPVKLAFELIASVAQPDPGNDGTYLLHTGKEIIDEYADFTAQHDMLLILDVQIGRSTVANEIQAVRPWLERPNVELAIDPEFSMAEGQVPGQVIGGVDASAITEAQQTLAQLSADQGIPPKILIVHQFFESMIRNRAQLAPVPGVQLVIDVDGFGSPDDKTKVYNQFVADAPIQFGGLKLFYKHDDPLMTPEQVLQLNPPPDVVIYQ